MFSYYYVISILNLHTLLCIIHTYFVFFVLYILTLYSLPYPYLLLFLLYDRAFNRPKLASVSVSCRFGNTFRNFFRVTDFHLLIHILFIIHCRPRFHRVYYEAYIVLYFSCFWKFCHGFAEF